MAKTTIMLACAAGMSTSLLVTKMQAAAKKQGIEATIFAVPVSEAKKQTEEQSIDVILLGPQVRFMLDEFKETFGEKQIPVEVIPMGDYGMMNGENVLKLAQGLLK